MTRMLLAALFLLPLAACDSEPQEKATTKLDAVEVQPGTISDSMIILDDAISDGTAIDNSIPDDGTVKDDAKPAEDAGEAEDGEEDAGEGEAITATVAKKAPDPAAKAD